MTGNATATSPPTAFQGQSLANVFDEVCDALRHSAWAPLLTYRGIDLVDVLACSIHRTILHFTRLPTGEPVAERSTPTEIWNVWRTSVQHLAYRAKQDLLSRAAVRRAPQLRTVDFLFWPRIAGHCVAQQPVAAELRRRGASLGFLASEVTTSVELQRRGEAAMFAQAGWPEEWAAARNDGLRLGRSSVWQTNVTFGKTSTTDDATLSSMLRRVIVPLLPDACAAIVNADQAIECLRPRVVIVGYDITLEGRAACLAARRRGVASAMLLHGSFSGNVTLRRHVADRIVVSGNIHRRDLQNAGIVDERIVVCGAPYLDRRPTQTGKIYDRIVNQLQLDRSKPYVLIATSGPGHAVSHEHHRRTVDALARLSATMPSVQFIVKLHPKDLPDYYQAAARNHPQSRLRIVPRRRKGLPTDIFDWLQGCSLLITGASTTALEAMLVDVPAISVDLCAEFHDVGFIDAGAAVSVRSYQELVEAVPRLIGPSAEVEAVRSRARDFLAEMFFRLDGRSAERAADALVELRGAQP